MDIWTTRDILITSSKVLNSVALISSPLWVIGSLFALGMACEKNSPYNIRLLYGCIISVISGPFALLYTLIKQYYGDKSTLVAFIPFIPLVSYIVCLYSQKKKRN